MVRILIIAVIALALLAQAAFIINEGEQGVVFQFGSLVRIIQEPGLYFKYPFVQDVVMFEKRILAAEARPAEYITLDKKRLTVDTVSRWRITEPLVFYQTVRNYTGAIARLNDIIFARLRQEIANHDFKDFIRTEREDIMKSVTNGTAELAQRFGIQVIDVRIKRVDLPEEVQKSVFDRMKAERERIGKRYRAEGDEQARQIRANANKEKEIILAEAYRQSQALRGDGDAEATGIYAEAYSKDEEFYSFTRHLEIYQKVFGTETTILLRPDSDLLKYLDSPNPRSKPASGPATGPAVR
ncbi:MAG: protease modulator HflC [Desulfomonile tiedjei]|nr:protease modulator HflC [Desulfomonile tiedjei]